MIFEETQKFTTLAGKYLDPVNIFRRHHSHDVAGEEKIFRLSAFPPFRLSAFPPFRLSAFPPFRLSAFPPFRTPARTPEPFLR
ncbi:MAG: hypothetical protein ABMA26_10950 [Limisphaerales bacterium]